MGSRFFIAIAIVSTVLAFLIYSAINASAKDVVTVEQLIEAGVTRNTIQVGARVAANSTIETRSTPTRAVYFQVEGIDKPENKIAVVYQGILPDTLKPGRDVILQGSFDGKEFHAKELLTQCPSKYEPPVPGSYT